MDDYPYHLITAHTLIREWTFYTFFLENTSLLINRYKICITPQTLCCWANLNCIQIINCFEIQRSFEPLLTDRPRSGIYFTECTCNDVSSTEYKLQLSEPEITRSRKLLPTQQQQHSRQKSKAGSVNSHTESQLQKQNGRANTKIKNKNKNKNPTQLSERWTIRQVTGRWYCNSYRAAWFQMRCV